MVVHRWLLQAGCVLAALASAGVVGAETEGLAAAAPAKVAVPAARDFARLPEFSRIRLSPQGDYIAVATLRDDETNLAVMRLSDMQVTGGFRAGAGRHVNDFWWVSPRRLVMTFAEREGSLDQPYRTGEMVGMDIDGKNTRYLYGARGRASVGAQSTTEYGYARMVEPMPGDPRHAIISSDHYFDLGSDAQVSAAYRIDIHTGRTRQLARSPLTGWTSFLADTLGNVRFAVGRNPQTLAVESYMRAPGEQEWRRLPGDEGVRWKRPFSIAPDARSADFYLSPTGHGGRACLARQDLESGAHEMLSCDAVADLDSVLYSSDGGTILAAQYSSLEPKIDWVLPEHPDARLLRSMAENFPGQALTRVSWSQDGETVLLRIDSDRNPGEYYLLDRKTMKARYLLSPRSWIDPEAMGARRPMVYRSRDEKTDLYAQLTYPPGARDAQGLPTVVLIHGGPFGIWDEWFWDSEAQFLASRGYLVVQPNFRGSGGFGVHYQESARQAWSTRMIDDITDAAQAVVDLGAGDPDRLCVMGGSYGGYAALMSAIREPERYRCAVGYAGVYDLEALSRDSDIGRTQAGRNYLRQYVGGSVEQLREHSPMTYVEALQAPVLLVHGRRDARTPFSQAQAMRRELERLNKPFEWLEKANEGHGFFALENRIEWLETLQHFLDRHIGPAAAAAPAASPAVEE